MRHSEVRATGWELAWNFEDGKQLCLEVIQMPTREWYDSPQSKEQGWHVVPASTQGRVLAVRPTLRG
jgi:hypothetical protein